ncbi:MAG: hypothetical protein FJW31_17655 [Acidobacteria bacterium]|nr:hypothetical protein [Acidobacteriota bacterium]
MTQPKARACAQRGAAWLRTLLEDDGSFRGAVALDCYYKAPSALAFSGYTDDAVRVLDHVAAKYLLPGGDLDGTGVDWYDRFRIYPHAWLLWASVEPRRADLSQALSTFLVNRQNPETGGFRADENGTEEIMTTSLAGLALLRAGHHDAAVGAAQWLRRVFEAQPDLTRGLLHVWRAGLGLDEGDGSVWFRVDATQPRQWYFQYGISAALLADLARITGDHSWLSLAGQYLRASEHCHADRYSTPQSGKIGWGAAWTGALTGDAAYQALTAKVVDGLDALQGADGSWNGEGVYDAQPAPETAVARLDVTAEFVTLLSMMDGGRFEL